MKCQCRHPRCGISQHEEGALCPQTAEFEVRLFYKGPPREGFPEDEEEIPLCVECAYPGKPTALFGYLGNVREMRKEWQKRYWAHV